HLMVNRQARRPFGKIIDARLNRPGTTHLHPNEKGPRFEEETGIMKVARDLVSGFSLSNLKVNDAFMAQGTENPEENNAEKTDGGCGEKDPGFGHLETIGNTAAVGSGGW